MDNLADQAPRRLVKFQPDLTASLMKEGGEEAVRQTARERADRYSDRLATMVNNGLDYYTAQEMCREILIPTPYRSPDEEEPEPEDEEPPG